MSTGSQLPSYEQISQAGRNMDESDDAPLSSSPNLDPNQGESQSEVQDPEALLKDLLKQKLKDEENWKDCLRDYFCCMVVRNTHEEFFIKSDDVKDKPLYVKQKVLKNYLNGIAKERLLWAIGFLLVALFCLGAMNFMENLDEMFNKTTNCKVDLDVTNFKGSLVRESFVVARLLTGKCPPPQMDHITLEQNERLKVKRVDCDNPQTETNGFSVCFNMFKCDKDYGNCEPLFPLTENTD